MKTSTIANYHSTKVSLKTLEEAVLIREYIAHETSSSRVAVGERDFYLNDQWTRI